MHTPPTHTGNGATFQTRRFSHQCAAVATKGYEYSNGVSIAAWEVNSTL